MSRELLTRIETARKDGRLLASSAENLVAWIESGVLPTWAIDSLKELVEADAFAELNDRFYRYLAFGTGGMRGRTIGAVATKAETGTPSEKGTPEHPSVGSNLLNEFTVVRATIGLYRYTARWLQESGRFDRPKLVIAHDVRHFSRSFCELTASTWTRLGGTALIFSGPRSTPQLSFSVRLLKAHCGIVITASHNPPHDNGYKVYFEDGGQVVAPHDTGIIAEVEKTALAETAAHTAVDTSGVIVLPESVDEAYHRQLEDVVLDPSVFKDSKLRVVFTPIHGVGGIATEPLLKRFKVKYRTVEAQSVLDPRFPTVKSPNPENAEALSHAVALATQSKADVLMGTDPDCDRMGVAVRGPDGDMVLLSGNQVGVLLAEYRIAKMKKLGLIPKAGTESAALIKTFVTSPMQDKVAEAHGLKVVNTLTGFKWIAGKIRGYEEKLARALREQEGIALDYDGTDYRTRARLLQKHSTFYVFGDEESYGYLPSDAVRDKDGNAACLIFCELAAEAKKAGRTVIEQLDKLYLKYGYFLEGLGQIYYEGAAGAAKIARILASYRKSPPKSIQGVKVTKFTDFGRQVIKDADGERIPAQDLYFLELANGYRYAVRGSGTEPKIKFYLFAQAEVKSARRLPEVKAATKADLDAFRAAIEADAAARAEG
ncbi:phospho-sugar mutase [Opitutales bacterium ASA1]|uniref:phospho-sugar mutase n=1 Tax=Congregicoccus parvus TaxID=3081749 RepID=UPI002B292DCA|nr:phospho-sugar mutase [Opitutales bacterium ASA1]